MDRYLTAGDITLDMRMFTAKRRGKRIDLTPSEFKLLAYLMSHNQRVIPKEEILQSLWHREVKANSVESLVRCLRKKLGSDTIQTRYGFGYVVNPQ